MQEDHLMEKPTRLNEQQLERELTKEDDSCN